MDISFQNVKFYSIILANFNKITINRGNIYVIRPILNIIIENRFNNEIKFDNLVVSYDMFTAEKTYIANIKDENNNKSFVQNLFFKIYKDGIMDIHFAELEDMVNFLNKINKAHLYCYNINDETIQKNFETLINNFNKIYEISYPNVKLLSIIPKELFQASKVKKLNIFLEDGLDEYFKDLIIPNLTTCSIYKYTSESSVSKFFSIILKCCPVMEEFLCCQNNELKGIQEVFDVDIDIDCFDSNDIIKLLTRSKKQDFDIYFLSSNEYFILAKIMIDFSLSLFNKIKNIQLTDIKDSAQTYLPNHLNKIDLDIEDLIIMINNNSFRHVETINLVHIRSKSIIVPNIEFFTFLNQKKVKFFIIREDCVSKNDIDDLTNLLCKLRQVKCFKICRLFLNGSEILKERY